MKHLTLFFILIVLFGSPVFSQQYGYGGGLIYSTPLKNLGIDARMSIPLKDYGIDYLEGLWLVPQLSFYPSGEMFLDLGASLHLGVYKLNRNLFYGLTNISYSMWLNHDNSDNENANFSNMNWEFGAGWTTTKCLRPFAELRIDAIQFEFNVRAGLIYTINCKDYGQVPCSKPPKDPFPAPKK